LLPKQCEPTGEADKGSERAFPTEARLQANPHLRSRSAYERSPMDGAL